MPEMLFYERLVALNDKTHGHLRMKPIVNYRYAAQANSIPLLAAEFSDCAREYPIVFARLENSVTPAVLLGLREKENLFVGARGKWDGRYVPAFVRRYPFLPVRSDGGQLLVCVDEAASCFEGKSGELLFENGKPGKALDHAMSFLREFQQGVDATEAVAARIQALDLLRDADSVAQLKDGSQFRLSGLAVIDEKKLAALDRDVVFELFTSGVLGLIHAHLISLRNLGNLVDRTSERTSAAKLAHNV